jgi:hypothetical protein
MVSGMDGNLGGCDHAWGITWRLAQFDEAGE